MIRTRVGAPDFDKITAGLESEVAGFFTSAMRDTTDEVKEAFRNQVRAAGLGERLPNSIRGITYPKTGNALEPAGWVYATPSKDGRGAAAIVESYATGAMITPRAGKRWLAVPTDDCPRKRQGDAMTPEEVEKKFGRRLVFISPNDRGFTTPSQRKGGVAYLVIKQLVIRKATGRWRNATQREQEGRTRNPRPVQNVIMFTLVPQVKKPKSIDLTVPQEIAAQRFPANLDARWR
ncbi:DUF6441 family protein [Sphingomonas sp. CFBP 8760]|uniref:DUF6441 family protein n=1 Tax=Sphingomonas sp. CFBP 8760 TaxID=2775282 RepID=UPI00177EFE2E|nr:DUF6441 family protein [Sphingomonas sp. CFBP 8760]MBD8548007.1 hypothetical protein [Sphingomonas sp. CFBP 8760]